MAVESAEEFAYELDHCNSHSWSGSVFDRKEAARLIRERDADVALAAKRDMLMGVVARLEANCGTAGGWRLALADLMYTQPSEPGQEKR